jgi:prepilin-type processing-associated H-X9-DG protein
MSSKVLAVTVLMVFAAAGTALAVATASLSSFLLSSGEQTNYKVSGHPATQDSIKAFVNYGGGSKKDKQAETAELLKTGFVGAADEQLRASHGRQAFSLVMEFSSDAGAQAAAAYMLKGAIQNQKGAKIAHFKVKGVPGARGITAHSGNASTANAYWADGHCTFGSGDYVPEHAGPLSKPVIAGIQSLYRRVKGACPS